MYEADKLFKFTLSSVEIYQGPVTFVQNIVSYTKFLVKDSLSLLLPSTLLHSERPKLYTNLFSLSVIRLKSNIFWHRVQCI